MSHCPMCGSPLPPPAEEPRIEAALDAVCRRYQVTRTELRGKARHKSIAEARQVAMYLTRRLTSMSFPEIGRAFGNRDHTTAMQALRKLETTTNDRLLGNVEAVLVLIGAKDPMRKAG